MRKYKAKSSAVVFKMNLSKDYDQIEWEFLRWILQEHQFPTHLIKCIMNYVTSVSYQLVINGSLSDSFVPSRGLRQCDPLSPYLLS